MWAALGAGSHKRLLNFRHQHHAHTTTMLVCQLRDAQKACGWHLQHGTICPPKPATAPTPQRRRAHVHSRANTHTACHATTTPIRWHQRPCIAIWLSHLQLLAVKCGHAHAFEGGIEALQVEVGPEQADAAVRRRIRLEALKCSVFVSVCERGNNRVNCKCNRRQ